MTVVEPLAGRVYVSVTVAGMLAASIGSLKLSVTTSLTCGLPALEPAVVSVIPVSDGFVVLTLSVAAAEVVVLPALSEASYSYS